MTRFTLLSALQFIKQQQILTSCIVHKYKISKRLTRA
ncbi:unnamed protein product [Schistosoma curassoni]|uniref:Uncharacterized protein n=1 Tax=Schistosoma curassoni TaxID=6186 RepID=A0A183L1M6_9TREM|nr:unnamed protein product [Schistosoma curassoni]